jgi:RNA polymerase sigma-70 factor (ECF subfamily)
MNAHITESNDLIPTRYSLLSRLQDWDDQDSWKDFFDTYWRLIYSFAMKSGLTESEAEDVVQETVISVAKNIQKFERDRSLGTFKGWLRNLTRWRIADHLRKRSEADAICLNLSDDVSYEQAMTEVEASAEAESVWDEEWRQNLVKVAMENLKHLVKEEQYQIFDLYVVKQWSPTLIAQTLGVSIGQVYLTKYRVGSLLRKEIRRLDQCATAIK